MASPAREYSLEQHLLDRFRFSGMDKENLTDLVSIIASLKNKYGITPFATHAEGQPVRESISARYLLDSIVLNKLMNVVLDTPRLNRVTIIPRGLPKTTQFEVRVTLGG